MTYDIIIPHYGTTDALTTACRACLRSIAAYSDPALYRVIFLDNASGQFPLIEPEIRKHPHTLIRNTENLGFVKAVNQGIWLSTAPYIVLMNNDTLASPGWLEKLREPLTGKVGLCGPRTTTERSWQGRAPAGPGWRILAPGRMLAFFCTMFRREVFERVGVLDESYGVGLGDDDDYCRRAERAGWQMALRQDLVITHSHRSTFHTLYSPERVKQMQEVALAKFHREA